jgi:hypothetical protein
MLHYQAKRYNWFITIVYAHSLFQYTVLITVPSSVLTSATQALNSVRAAVEQLNLTVQSAVIDEEVTTEEPEPEPEISDAFSFRAAGVLWAVSLLGWVVLHW